MRRTPLFVVVTLALASLATVLLPAARSSAATAPASVSWAIIGSGAGQTEVWGGFDGSSVSVGKSSPSQVDLSVANSAGTVDEVVLSAPTGKTLASGSYPYALTTADAQHPGMQVFVACSGDGDGGGFTIDDIAFSGQTLTRISVDLETDCAQSYQHISYDEPAASSGGSAQVMPASVNLAPQDPDTSSVTSVVVASGAAALSIGSVSLRNSTLGFAIADDGCAGSTVPAGSACEIDLSFRPTVAGAVATSLLLTTSQGDRTVPVTGDGIAGTTSWSYTTGGVTKTYDDNSDFLAAGLDTGGTHVIVEASTPTGGIDFYLEFRNTGAIEPGTMYHPAATGDPAPSLDVTIDGTDYSSNAAMLTFKTFTVDPVRGTLTGLDAVWSGYGASGEVHWRDTGSGSPNTASDAYPVPAPAPTDDDPVIDTSVTPWVTDSGPATSFSYSGDAEGIAHGQSGSTAQPSNVVGGGDLQRVQYSATTSDNRIWELDFGVPSGRVLVPGTTYTSSSSGAGFDVTASGSGCEGAGSFTVKQISYDPVSDRLRRLLLTFTYTCTEAGGGSVTGRLAYQALAPGQQPGALAGEPYPTPAAVTAPPSSSPVPSTSPSPSGTATPSVSASSSATPAPSVSASATPVPSGSPSPSASTTPTRSSSPSPPLTPTPTQTPVTSLSAAPAGRRAVQPTLLPAPASAPLPQATPSAPTSRALTQGIRWSTTRTWSRSGVETLKVTIRSTGTGSLHLTGLAFRGAAARLWRVTGRCPSVLTHGTHCTITLRRTAAYPTRAATLVVSSGAGKRSVALAVRRS